MKYKRVVFFAVPAAVLLLLALGCSAPGGPVDVSRGTAPGPEEPGPGEDPEPPEEPPEEPDFFRDELGGEVVAVPFGPAGTEEQVEFLMGDPDLGGEVRQTISRPFSISPTEVTNAQYRAFVADGGYTNSSYWTTNGWDWLTDAHDLSGPAGWEEGFTEDRLPVVGVSWFEAVAFCNWLSDKAGLARAYDDAGKLVPGSDGYRLPTEVEWEYTAARAGAPDRQERLWPFGDVWNAGWVVCGLSRPEPVGSRPEGNTPLGISDMAGNAWEWCSDSFQEINRVESGVDRYHFQEDADFFVVRGCNFQNTNELFYRSAHRIDRYPDLRKALMGGYGFRVARWTPEAAD